jgi:RHH-type transcriptional regulator, proline utilization regulon repressor / proline dehydrogenase / delta 1-pyrroline-5-carboxylate dehydrogenase
MFQSRKAMFDLGDAGALKALSDELAIRRLTEHAARRDSTPAEITAALDTAAIAHMSWNRLGAEVRADCLDRAAQLLEQNRLDYYDLLMREAGETLSDAITEVRDGVDFCRCHAQSARDQFKPLRLDGPTGELNELHLSGRGVFVCISPSNRPLSAFAAQVTAALVAGNTVVAKPAESTPLIAALFVTLLHEAGVTREALHLTQSPGQAFADAAFAHPALAGVAFTGAAAIALSINRALSQRSGAIVALIAETGHIGLTGPNPHGPHYLANYAQERTLTVNTTATGGNAALLNLQE